MCVVGVGGMNEDSDRAYAFTCGDEELCGKFRTIAEQYEFGDDATYCCKTDKCNDHFPEDHSAAVATVASSMTLLFAVVILSIVNSFKFTGLHSIK